MLAKYLGIISILIGVSMVFSLPWASPLLGEAKTFEWAGFLALSAAIAISLAIGGGLYYLGKDVKERLFHREAIAVVGLSWILASVLGAIPFYFSGTHRDAEHRVTSVDAFFESISGFSGTGATILTDLEDSQMIPRCILFWRSETHFLGGLGIMVLFVAILAEGSAAKTLMRSEMAGPRKDTDHSRARQAAWAFSYIYLGLIVILTILLLVQGMSAFDAICHSFGAIATGGFSTYNASVSAYNHIGIEMTLAVFMVIACVNFSLLNCLVWFEPKKLFQNIEFRVYLAIVGFVTLMLAGVGWYAGDFAGPGEALRYSFFQVASIQTNTGFVSKDFDQWNEFARGTLFVLMFIGGCAGSTSCSVKVIRYILLFKILGRAIERFYHPKVVRPIRLGNETLNDPELARNILVYFAFVGLIFATSWLTLLAVEPNSTWTNYGQGLDSKLIDCASGVTATLNGVGPGLGTVGATQNYAHYSAAGKMLFSFLMLLGRLEIFAVLVLFAPNFWRGR